MSNRYGWRNVDTQNKDLVDSGQKPTLKLYTRDVCYSVTWPSDVDVPRFVEVLEDLDRRELLVTRDGHKNSGVLFTDASGRYEESFATNEELFRYLRENADKIGRFLRVDVAGTSYTRDFIPFEPTTVGAVNRNEVKPDNIFELMRQTVEHFDEDIIGVLRDVIELPPPTAPSPRQ